MPSRQIKYVLFTARNQTKIEFEWPYLDDPLDLQKEFEYEVHVCDGHHEGADDSREESSGHVGHATQEVGREVAS